LSLAVGTAPDRCCLDSFCRGQKTNTTGKALCSSSTEQKSLPEAESAALAGDPALTDMAHNYSEKDESMNTLMEEKTLIDAERYIHDMERSVTAR